MKPIEKVKLGLQKDSGEDVFNGTAEFLENELAKIEHKMLNNVKADDAGTYAKYKFGQMLLKRFIEEFGKARGGR